MRVSGLRNVVLPTYLRLDRKVNGKWVPLRLVYACSKTCRTPSDSPISDIRPAAAWPIFDGKVEMKSFLSPLKPGVYRVDVVDGDDRVIAAKTFSAR